MKKVSLFGIIAFALLTINGIWQSINFLRQYSQIEDPNSTQTMYILTNVFYTIAVIMLLIFFVGLYRKEKEA